MKLYKKIKGMLGVSTSESVDSGKDSKPASEPEKSGSREEKKRESGKSSGGNGRSRQRGGSGSRSSGGGGSKQGNQPDKSTGNGGAGKSADSGGKQQPAKSSSGTEQQQQQGEHGRHSGDSDSRRGGRRRGGRRGGRSRGRGGRSGGDNKSQQQTSEQQPQKSSQEQQQKSGSQQGGGGKETKSGGGGQGGSSRRRGRRRKGNSRKRRDLGGRQQRVEFPELLELTAESEQYVNNEFRPLGLNDKIVMALARNRFRTPTDIQREVIPVGIEGRDILGQAKTGTGKTVAFLMPLFQKLDHDLSAVQALIVVPTRELCRQVSWEARRFSRMFDFKVMSVYGGTSVKNEIEELKTSPGHIVVGTPGRLLDHISNRNMDLSKLNTLVLDEADRMFDIGFRDDIIKIIKACPDKRQIMLLSATMDNNVEDLARRFMDNPVKLYVSKDEITVDSIWQRYIPVERNRKIDTLTSLLKQQNPTQSIIFTNTKRMSDAVALKLDKQGFKARCIHSDLSQNKRERIMDDFRTGKIEHLVATDVAARGLDITGISHVINYDIPDNPEDYVHRVGRTGRMGAAGKAFTFVSGAEGELLTKVEIFMDKMLEGWELGDAEDEQSS